MTSLKKLLKIQEKDNYSVLAEFAQLLENSLLQKSKGDGSPLTPYSL